METEGTFAAFAETKLVSKGSLEQTISGVKAYVDRQKDATVLVFDEATGMQCDFDLRGTLADVLAALEVHPVFGKKKAGPGRPKLGVVSREVSLLPRHWEWLEAQPGGLSVALRRLVEEASTDKARLARARERQALEATSKLMWALAGNLDGFEEASRALFAKDGARLAKLVKRWPKDVRDHLLALYGRAVPTREGEAGQGRAEQAGQAALTPSADP